MWIDFDDIWQKYSKDSRIELACFSLLLLKSIHEYLDSYSYQIEPGLKSVG